MLEVFLARSRQAFPALTTKDSLDALVMCGLDPDLAIEKSQACYPQAWGGYDDAGAGGISFVGGIKTVSVSDSYSIKEATDFKLVARGCLAKVGIDCRPQKATLRTVKDFNKMGFLKVSTFLNRLLGIPVKEQSLLYDLFHLCFEK